MAEVLMALFGRNVSLETVMRIRCVPSFYETKERSGKTLLARLNRAADVIVYEFSGLMFWLTRKKFVGSYLPFKVTRRS